MNWKWWVAAQIAILAWLGEVMLPFAELFFLSIIYKLDRRIFWLYIGYDTLSYARLLSKLSGQAIIDPTAYQDIGKTVTSFIPIPGPQISPRPADPFITVAYLIGASVGIVVVIYFMYVRPIRFMIRLRRRILHEVLHIQ